MAAIPFGPPQTLDISFGPGVITLPESPDPNAQVAYVFFDTPHAVELHSEEALDGAYLPIAAAHSGDSFPVGPFPLNVAPRYVDAGSGSATETTVQVLRVVP